MLIDMLDWLNLAIGIVTLCLTLTGTDSSCRRCRRERYRSLKFLGVEWTTYEREDDSRS